ncbi:MAG: hypothetical protein KDA80_21415 [Planctomycetaceae bacterium]|nr:hypothetical protein [Planctomycetaceae bacterium]
MAAKIGTILLTLVVSIPASVVGLVALVGMPKLQELGEALLKSEGTDESVALAPWEASFENDGFGYSTGDWDDAPSFSRDTESSKNRQTGANPSSGNPFASMVASSPSNRGNPSPGTPSDSHPLSAYGHNDNVVAQPAQSPSGVESTATRWPSPESQTSQAAVPATPVPTGFTQSAPNAASIESAQATANATLGGGQLSWRQASLKLAEMGIDKYHLEQGSNRESFLFVCLFSPADSQNVTHRFETEAADPLQAVNQTLDQVDQWLRQRYAAQNFPKDTGHLSFQPTSEIQPVSYRHR